MAAIYLIPGSPCCGKSTLARLLAEQCGLTYICCDDFEGEFLQRGEAEDVPGIASLSRRLARGTDAQWLRSPAELFADELAYYEASFPWLWEKLTASPQPLIAEGAALLPHRLQEQSVPADRVFCLTPTGDFQRTQYARREWVAPYLASSSDPAAAFRNWMDRDALMASFVADGAQRSGYPHQWVDGARSLDATAALLQEHFHL